MTTAWLKDRASSLPGSSRRSRLSLCSVEGDPGYTLCCRVYPGRCPHLGLVPAGALRCPPAFGPPAWRPVR
jgi:hypothetical protein